MKDDKSATFLLRFKEDDKTKMKILAKENGRSLNSELLQAIYLYLFCKFENNNDNKN